MFCGIIVYIVYDILREKTICFDDLVYQKEEFNTFSQIELLGLKECFLKNYGTIRNACSLYLIILTSYYLYNIQNLPNYGLFTFYHRSPAPGRTKSPAKHMP